MIQAFLRQPFVHFLVIGGAFFVLFQLFDDAPAVPDRSRILVSKQDAMRLAKQFGTTWRRSPTPEELNGLIDNFVREEIYVREARALGLDQGDMIVRRRLRQKMEFLTETGAQAVQVDDTILRAYYLENADAFTLAPRIGFSQVLIPKGQPDALENVLGKLTSGVDPKQLEQQTLLPIRVPVSARQAIDGTFGTGFFDRLADMEIGQWVGPITSGYGQHVVRINRREPGLQPPFEIIRYRIELDWRTQKAEELRGQRFEALRNQYLVERPDADIVLAQ